ncbi:glycosyl transferase [Candidatus Vecturithrix granuli]|uniref:Glycosyl transferase n=1 Tax=Vecturithrix granuli TaxID=1499967 RepID=A0A081C5B5_VECG1|nr:glycosyl transferase [Candidatus Vecturithrix granuli]
MEHPLVSVIIVNWNGAKYLPACLSALMQQTYTPIEIVIVDNASTDDSCQVIEAFQHRHQELRTLTLLRNSSNTGFCRGNNQGIQHSHGDFVLLLNADVTLAADFIERLVHLMSSDPMVGIALGKLLSGENTSKLDSTGIVILKNRRALDRGQREEDRGQYDVREEVFGASGAACLYRKAMLDQIMYPGEEYLDELFFAYKEDVDLAWRARLAGWKCMYAPEAVGTHFRTWGTGKRGDIPKWVRRHSLKNRYLMLFKNECWRTFAPDLLRIAWYEICSLIYILIWEPYLLSVIGEILRYWPEILVKRRRTQHFATAETRGNLRQWFH